MGTTYGTGWMHRNLTRMLRWMDVRVLYVFSAVFIVPVTMFFRTSRHAYRFLRTAFGWSRLKAFAGTYTNLRKFSQVVIDRFAMYAGKKFDLVLVGKERFDELAKEEDGFIQLSAHVGNYELAGYSLVAEDKPMNALVFGGEKQTVMDSREQMFDPSHIKMIPIQSDMSHVFNINNALSDGEIMSMPADRMLGSAKKVSVTFFGRTVNLPAGPFTIAAARGCEVLAVNVMKSGTKQYTIIVTPIEYDRAAGRKQQIACMAQAYATELERVLRLYPHQWYNYFDFWNQ